MEQFKHKIDALERRYEKTKKEPSSSRINHFNRVRTRTIRLIKEYVKPDRYARFVSSRNSFYRFTSALELIAFAKGLVSDDLLPILQVEPDHPQTIWDNFILISTTHRNYASSYYSRAIGVFQDNHSAYYQLYDLRPKLAHLIRSKLILNPIKFNLTLNCSFFRIVTVEGTTMMEEKTDIYIESKWHQSLISPTEIDSTIDKLINEILTKIDNSLENGLVEGSGWQFYHCLTMYLNITKFAIPIGSSFIESPPAIAKCRSIVNPENNDNNCLMWALIIATHKEHIPENKHKRFSDVSRYKSYVAEFKSEYFDNNEPFPLEASAFTRLENENKIIVNLHIWQKGNPYPYMISENRDKEDRRTYNILVIKSEDDETDTAQRYHFVAILDFPLFITRRKNKRFVCPYCYYKTSKTEKFELHGKIKCFDMTDSAIICECPKEGQRGHLCEFDAFNKLYRIPITVTLDYETILEKHVLDNEEREKIDKARKKNKRSRIVHKRTRGDTVITREHRASHIAICVAIDPDFVEAFEDEGISEGAREWNLIEGGQDFDRNAIEYLIQVREALDNIVKKVVMSEPTEDNYQDYALSESCKLCAKEFDPSESFEKCLHMDRHTGRYFGALCNRCSEVYNLNRAVVPCFIHNLRGYDARLLIHALKKFRDWTIKPLANSVEKFQSINFNRAFGKPGIMFLDSFQHFGGSLDESVENNLKNCQGDAGKINETFRMTYEHFGNFFKDFAKKGAMPYSYIDSVEKLQETRLPPLEDWRDDLRGGEIPISQERYLELVDLFNRLQCKTILDFQRHYVLSDVTLLNDVVRVWRDYILNLLGVDPAYFVSCPGITWSAMLLNNLRRGSEGVEISNMTDLNMHHLTKNNIRGGLSVITAPYAKGVNDPSDADYDPSKPTTKIFYFDANQLYGYCERLPLPYGNYQWLSGEDLPDESASPEDIAEWLRGEPLNRCYVIDAHVPDEMHDLLNDYSPCIGRKSVNYKDLSEYTKKQIKKYYDKEKPVSSVPKLLQTLEDEREVLHHARYVMYMLDHGVQITKIHRAFSFDESEWMRPYVDMLNAERAKQRGNKLLYGIVKLCANAIYGRTIMDLSRHKDIQIETDEDKIIKKSSLFNCSSVRSIPDIYNDNNPLFVLDMAKTSIKLTQPIIIGFAILEYSKIVMGRFWYDTIKKKYGPNARLLGTDTDSLFIELTGTDIMRDLWDTFADDLDLSGEDPKLFYKYALEDLAHQGNENPTDEEVATYTKERLNRNAALYGKFKSEVATPIREFIALQSKTYAIRLDDDKLTVRSKGIPRHIRNKRLNWEAYKNALEGGNPENYTMARFRSKNLQLQTLEQSKTGLIAVNDKRYCPDAYAHTLAFGHYKLRR